MKRRAILIMLVTMMAVGSFGQRPDSALAVLATKYPTEKIYIHYDKSYYIAGETIWFKAYLYNNGLPSTLSNNFYLQLIDNTGKVISSKKYPVRGATVSGDIELPDSLSQGYYHIRALTPAMLNNNRDFLYSKNVFVFNNNSSVQDDVVLPTTAPLTIEFFPESGRLIGDVLSVIAFKATDSTGKPANLTGTIKTDDGTVITTFKTMAGGMGKVQFKPQAGKKYLAAVDINGQTVFYPLPEVVSSGINLRIENEKNGKVFLLSRSKKDKTNLEDLWLIAVMNNMIVFESPIKFESYFSVKGHLLTDSLPSGVLHFTVFDKENKPLAERITFVNNGEYTSNASVDIVKKGTGPREENIIEINFPDIAQRSCSVSVTDEEQTAPFDKENIVSSFLLTEDVTGISDPVWYLEDKNDSVRQTIFDDLLISRNWQRFSWKKILDGEFPDRTYEDQYLVRINGDLKDSKTNQPVAGGGLTVFLESEDSVNHNFEIPVGNDGRFTIDSLLIYGRSKLFYSYKTLKGKEIAVNVSLDPLPTDRAVDNLSFSLSDADKFAMKSDPLPSALRSSKRPVAVSLLTKTKELDPVIVESKTNKRPIDIVNEKYTSGVFTSLGKLNVDNINQPNNDKSISVFDYIRNFVSQVEVQDNNFVNRKNFSLTASPSMAQEKTKREKEQTAGGGTSPGDFLDFTNTPGKKFIVALFLNESVTDIGALKTIRMDEVALIKFYDPGFVGAGSGGPGGALCVYTKKEVKVEGRLEKLDHVVFNGYSLNKRFNNSDHGVDDPKQQLVDGRATIYWNPDLFTDENSKKITIRFYNNDISKRFRVVVEGFDGKGRLIHVEKIISN